MFTMAIVEEDLLDARSLHERLMRELRFPAYYGCNLSALDDCLGDIDCDVRLVVVRAAGPARREWLDGFCRVMQRAAALNGAVHVVVIEPDGQLAPMLQEVLAKLDGRIEPALQEVKAKVDAMEPHVPQQWGMGDMPGPTFAGPRNSAAPVRRAAGRETARNLATGSDGDRFECGACGCRVSDLLEESRFLFDGIRFCPNCGSEISNPGGSESMKWVGELI